MRAAEELTGGLAALGRAQVAPRGEEIQGRRSSTWRPAVASMARGAPVQRRERMDERQRKPREGGGTRERATALICWFSGGRRGAELLLLGWPTEAIGGGFGGGWWRWINGMDGW